MILSFIFNNILLGVGLAMDAFSVSMANGLSRPKMSRRMKFFILLVFAGFQFLMPITGWLCVRFIVNAFSLFRHAIPWISLFLLLYIGVKMLIEGLNEGQHEKNGEKKKCADNRELKLGELLLQGVATSIDALSVGFTIANYCTFQAIMSGFIIGGITFALCSCGLNIGQRFGTRLSGKASISGGIILICIGIEIFITGVLK